MENLPQWAINALDWLEKNGTTYALKAAMAVAVLIAGFWLVNRFSKIMRKGLSKAGLEQDVSSFLTSLVVIAIKVFIAVFAIGLIGVNVAAFLGVFAAAGLAIGLALQGSLSNFAAGIIIMILRPYKVNDWVEIQEKFGKVEDIQIFHTIITTPGLKTIIVPNGQVIEGVITNFSNKGFIRMELVVTMPYEESFPRVEAIINQALYSIPKVLQEPVPEVGILNYDSHNIQIAVRPYVLPDDFWEVTFEAYQKIKAAFNAENVHVAYSEGVEIGKIGA